MLDDVPADFQAALDLGITLFAGEAEGHLEYPAARCLSPRTLQTASTISSTDLPGLDGAAAPYCPRSWFNAIPHRSGHSMPDADARSSVASARSSTCRGASPAHRIADDVEQLLRAHLEAGVIRFFITDDDFARNRHWEAYSRSDYRTTGAGEASLHLPDPGRCAAYRIPHFVEKCRVPGACGSSSAWRRSIAAKSAARQETPEQDRATIGEMLQAWRSAGIITFCGYILGFPEDTAASIERRHRYSQARVACRLSGVLRADTTAGIRGPSETGSCRRPDGSRHEQVRSRSTSALPTGV